MIIKASFLAGTIVVSGMHFAELAAGDRANSEVVHVSDDAHSDKHVNHMSVIAVGSLQVSDPVIRATLPNAPVSGGYIVIKNDGDKVERLIGGTAEFAGKIEIHDMSMNNGVMKMREIEGGLEIPPGQEVVLKPGGKHIMFMKLTERMLDGEMRKVTLEFEKAGSIEVDFTVKQIKPGMSDEGHSGHMKKE